MKTIYAITTAFVMTLLSTAVVYAAGLGVKIESPESPTNQKNFRLSFVALDIQDRPVAVTCYYKRPSEGSFNQFDSTKNLQNGGNSGFCQVTDSQISPIGTYEFRVVAKAGEEEVVSNIVSVSYDDSRPGKPENYSKEKTSDCTFRITFKTANDGKTTKVEVYRSENTLFDVNGGTRIGEVALGPNQTGEFTNTAPDCSKTYYYVLRSFDAAGNASDPVGDGITVTTTTTTSTSNSPAIGAIPVGGVSGGTGQGSILGESDEASVSASPSPSPESSPAGAVQGAMDAIRDSLQQTNNRILVGIGLILLAALAFWLYRRTTR